MQKQHTSDRLEVLAQGQVGTLWHLTSGKRRMVRGYRKRCERCEAAKPPMTQPIAQTSA